MTTTRGWRSTEIDQLCDNHQDSASNAGGLGSIPIQGTKIPHAGQSSQNTNNNNRNTFSLSVLGPEVQNQVGRVPASRRKPALRLSQFVEWPGSRPTVAHICVTPISASVSLCRLLCHFRLLCVSCKDTIIGFKAHEDNP